MSTTVRPASHIVWTSEAPEYAASLPIEFDRYYYGACNRGLPLNADGVSCSGACHPEQD